MASAVSALTGSSSPSSTGTSSSSSTDLSSAPTEQMFLQLLVAQLQNQDPLNPTDSTQFVSQLAQFSELEQVMAIRSDIETEMADQSAAQNSSTTSNTTDTSNSSGTTPSTGQTQS